MDVLIGIAILAIVAFGVYKAGKQLGSRKGYWAGRQDRKRGKNKFPF
jgi:hypothetical protein